MHSVKNVKKALKQVKTIKKKSKKAAFKFVWYFCVGFFNIPQHGQMPI